jgi:hypothetical protein
MRLVAAQRGIWKASDRHCCVERWRDRGRLGL